MTLVYILYDSINNTVFAGQVWSMLLKFLAQNSYQKIILISFETKLISHNYANPAIQIIQIKRTRYWGKICLILDFLKIIKYLPKQNYQVIARGPFAGYLALKTNQLLLNKPKIVVQARGLASAEYDYSHQQKTPSPKNKPISRMVRQANHERALGKYIWFIYQNIFTKIRVRQLFKLEQTVYSCPDPNLKIECVSNALKDYLMQNFNAHPNQLTIAQNDLPVKIKPSKLATWRKQIRQKFGINLNAEVYCYSGSTHPWQCPELTIDFFKNKLAQDQSAFLLILTNQKTIFEKLLQAASIPMQNYLVLNVNYQQIYQYLAAANYGLLFREAHILNWVSRPTKALEYASANLEIIHNQTIAWLVNKKNQAKI